LLCWQSLPTEHDAPSGLALQPTSANRTRLYPHPIRGEQAQKTLQAPSAPHRSIINHSRACSTTWHEKKFGSFISAEKVFAAGKKPLWERCLPKGPKGPKGPK